LNEQNLQNPAQSGFWRFTVNLLRKEFPAGDTPADSRGNDAAPAKPIPPLPNQIMRKKLFYLLCMLILSACENAPFKAMNGQISTMLTAEQSIPDSASIARIQRKRQLSAIESAFARRTTADRASQLAHICYEKTRGTVFTPFDLAEIALAETGGHHLSGQVVSPMGAVGVWQLMPQRARSHGYTATDMRDDTKCAEAAVRELYVKLDMAQGDLERAKKYYCGQGPHAVAYMKKIRHLRQEMMADYEQQNEKMAQIDTLAKVR
jgi:hypothetical protein